MHTKALMQSSPWTDLLHQVSQPILSGSQSSILPPAWWPKGNQNPISHVFRAMRPDMDDLRFVHHIAHSYDDASDEMRIEVLYAVRFGSKNRSPFLHTSMTLTGASRWASHGQTSQGRKLPFSHVMVKIDFWSWYQSGSMPRRAVIRLVK